MIEYLWIIWLVAGVFFLIAEIFTAGFFVSLIGIACFASGFTALFIKSIPIQLLVFILFCLILLIFIRPIIKKYTKVDSTPSNVNALIGKEVVVSDDIYNLESKGYVKSGGDYWRAKSISGETIKKGTPVIIEKMEGITAFVKLKNDQ